MKKVIPGLFLLMAAVFTTGCLGDAETQILGAWRYVPVNPNQAVVHPMEWWFLDDGTIIYTDLVTSQKDTGNYELFMDGTHRMFRINNVDMKDPYLPMKGEWFIVKLDFNTLVVGTKNYGGFQQRDLTK